MVLNRTVVDSDWRFDNLYGSHLQSQSELYHVSWWYYTLVIDLISQLLRDVIGRLSVKPWCCWLWRLVISKWCVSIRILFSAKTQIYQQNTHTYTNCSRKLSISILSNYYTKLFSPIYLEEMKTYTLLQNRLSAFFFSSTRVGTLRIIPCNNSSLFLTEK